MGRSQQNCGFLILLMCSVCFGTLGDFELSPDGAKLILNNNSQTFSIAASGSMSESVNYSWPAADATSGGQALLSDAAGVLSFGVPTTSASHDVLSTTHDATTSSVSRGSIIFGNSTPKWDELVKGAANTFLKSDGTDVAYSLMLVSSPVTLTGATIGWDSTLIDATTWSDGTNATNQWDFDVSGTDHTMTAGSGVMTFSHDISADKLILTDPSQDWKFIGRSGETPLWLESQTLNTPVIFRIASKSADGGDDVQIQIWGEGGVDDITDRERMLIGWDTGTSQYQIQIESDGAGTTLRPLVLFTEGNTDQIKLNTNGTVELNADVSGLTKLVVDNLTFNGNSIVSDTATVRIGSTGLDIITTGFGDTTLQPVSGNFLLLKTLGGENITFDAGDAGGQVIVTGSDFIVDTDTLFVDSSNHTVGIGTANPPLASLEIRTVDPATTAYIRFAHTGVRLWEIYGTGTADRDLTFKDASGPLDVLTFQAITGNVGIGNSAPAVSLEVGDATGEEIIRVSSGGNSNAILSANSFFSTGNPLTQYIVAGGNNWSTGVDNADSDKYKISFDIDDLATNNFLTIDTTGNVGIGTSIPQKNLHIESGVPTIRLSDDNAATDQAVATLIEFYRGNNTNRVGYVGMESSSNNNLKISTDYAAGQLTLGTGSNVTALTIDSSGNVGIGTTAPDVPLEINHATAPAIRLTYNDADGSATNYSQFQTGSDGDLTITTVDSDGAAGDVTFNPDGHVILTNGVIFLNETTTPTAKANHGAIYTKNTNELFFQDGAGVEHLLHGDSFSTIWFHGISTVEVTISVIDTFTLIDSFTVVGNEDDLSNAVGDFSANTITLSSNSGGEYKVTYHGSITATGGADKEMIFAYGITLATPKDITNVTDDLVSPIVITSVAHGLDNGDMVEIAGVLGNTAANGSFIVDSKAADTFVIVALDGNATTGNGNYNEGSPTGDITIEYPGQMVVHRMVRGADLGAMSATGIHELANSDVISLYVANVSGTTNLTVAAISLGLDRIGD